MFLLAAGTAERILYESLPKFVQNAARQLNQASFLPHLLYVPNCLKPPRFLRSRALQSPVKLYTYQIGFKQLRDAIDCGYFLPLWAGDLELNFLGTLVESLLVATKIEKT